MMADPEWQIYVKKLTESGLLMDQKTSLMVPAKFCADQAVNEVADALALSTSCPGLSPGIHACAK